MKRLLRMPSFYISAPLLLTCGLTLLTYDLPPDYLEGMVLLATVALALLALDAVLGICKIVYEIMKTMISAEK